MEWTWSFKLTFTSSPYSFNMVYTNRPITKFCCSDKPESEIRIIATFSIVSTFICLFLLFLAFAHHHEKKNPNEDKNFLPQNYSDYDTNIADSDGFNVTTTITTTTTTTPKPIIISRKSTETSIKASLKKESIPTLEWLCRLFQWERDSDTFWILVPCVWNFLDLLRAVLLLRAMLSKIICLLKLWYLLTSGNTLAGILIFYPILSNYKAGDLTAAFIVISALLLFYNCYSLWIGNVYLTQLQSISQRLNPVPPSMSILYNREMENTEDMSPSLERY